MGESQSDSHGSDRPNHEFIARSLDQHRTSKPRDASSIDTSSLGEMNSPEA